MQAQMTATSAPPRGLSFRRLLSVIFLLALIAGAYYGYTKGWFSQMAYRLSNAITYTMPTVTRAIAKLGDVFSPTTDHAATIPDNTVATSGAPAMMNEPGMMNGPVTMNEPGMMHGPIMGDAPIAPNAPFMAPTAPVMQDPIIDARGAYAAGDLNAAIGIYRSLIANTPNNVSAYGELGNVFYAAGMYAEATHAFYDAARLAISQNRLEVAENLLPVVMEANSMLASQLHEQLANAQMQAANAQMQADRARMAQPMPYEMQAPGAPDYAPQFMPPQMQQMQQPQPYGYPQSYPQPYYR